MNNESIKISKTFRKLNWVTIGFLLASIYSGGTLVSEISAVSNSASHSDSNVTRSRSPSGDPILELKDFPHTESDIQPDPIFPIFRSAQIIPAASDRRANVLVDINSLKSKTKLNGYASYIGYKTLPGSTTIDRFIYCQNFDETSLTVNENLFRTDLTPLHRFPCLGFTVDELLKGMNLIEFVGIEALSLKLAPGFDPNKGGTLSIAFLSKPLTHRQLNLSISKSTNGTYQLLSPKKVAFNQLDLEFRPKSVLTKGFPAGLTAMELFQKVPRTFTRVSIGRLVSDRDLPKRK